jgi:hypothetical protein
MTQNVLHYTNQASLRARQRLAQAAQLVIEARGLVLLAPHPTPSTARNIQGWLDDVVAELRMVDEMIGSA